MHQQPKNHFIPSIHSWGTVSFRVPWPDWPHPFLTMPTQIFFHQLSIYVNLYQYARITIFYWFLLKILLSKKSCNLIGWKHFGSYLRNKNFPKYDIYAETQQIIQIFIIQQIQWKLMIKFFINSKSPAFGSFLVHFPNFCGKTIFQKIHLSQATSYMFLAPYQNFGKTNDTIPTRMARLTDGWKVWLKVRKKDGQTIFHRTLPANARGPKRMNALV